MAGWSSGIFLGLFGAAGLCIWVTLAAAEPAKSTTHIDVLRPESCIPGAQLFDAEDEKEDDEVMAGIMQGKRKPDAFIIRFDPATQTVYIKRTPGSYDTIKLSDTAADHWTVVYEGKDSPNGTTDSRAPAASWQVSWDGFLTLAEQELNRLAPNAAGPWEGKEVTWQGTVQDMEVNIAKNYVRVVFDMPERTLKIKGQSISASRLMIFVPMQYENLSAIKKGATVRFKTTIAPIDQTHPSVSAQPGKDGGKGFLLVFTKGGTILK